jgi:diguanylate cyclase (GGDEF)-like protein
LNQGRAPKKGPLDWSPVDRCLLVGGITVPFIAGYWVLGEILLANPSLAPYYDFSFLRTFQRLLAAFIGLWAVVMTLGVFLRTRAPESRALVHATIQLYSIGNATGALCVGPVTSPHGFIILGGIAVGLVLFDRRAVLLGVASASAILGGGWFAVATGNMRYAPVLAAPPYAGGEVSSWWVEQMTIVWLSVAAAILLLFAYLVARLRDRERRLLVMSTTDALTGVANRRHFIDLFEKEFERAKRYKTPLSCVIMDLDHFKRINDRYGHLAGDRVLVSAARVFEKSLRTHDVLARWGGEEFVVLLPQTDVAGAEALAERLRRALEETEVLLEGGEVVRVTTSLGMACHPHPPAASGDELLRRADVALYDAKELGRNRLVSRPPKELAARPSPA